ncbi:MAG TPA: FAD-dependent oxidoreductase [Oscillatoriales cyanobacterium M59_W2019_021]|nr:FAD-dependent oxidoreductase [Oscillatoriales cyanobacterium M4454_W2019_049]HIK50268.1 FAD-dependent oxidoreductase [Oscillatoriales cyanobacterium M59_W2019_021]
MVSRFKTLFVLPFAFLAFKLSFPHFEFGLEKNEDRSANSTVARRVKTESFDVVVYGDELPGVCAAIWAKKQLGETGKVALVRSNSESEQFGGLITRGGLAFLDLDKTLWFSQPSAQCWLNFLDAANVSESCVDANHADDAIRRMLAEAGVAVISDAELVPEVENGKIKYARVKNRNLRLFSHAYIDATQQAELAVSAGMPYYSGFESQDPKLADETLSVSIVPVISGLTIDDIYTIEQDIQTDDRLMKEIENFIAKIHNEKATKFLLQNFDRPIYKPYRDGYIVLSAALGGAYHLQHQIPLSWQGFLFDKANICVLEDGSLSWNGLLFKMSVSDVRQIEQNQFQPSQDQIDRLKDFELWLQERSGKESVRVQIPPEIYVRQSINVREVVDPLSGKEIMAGGTFLENSIGSFSYDFDFRGGVNGLSIAVPPLPIFNFGIEHTLAKNIENLAVVGRSSGYEGIAVSVGRINTVNTYQGQGVGVAAALAKQLQVPLNSITSAETRQALESLTGLTAQFYGRDTSQGLDYGNIR